ncbi:MAG: ribosome small subunit-dependent GTPase A [Halothiobacillaceae bacterium]
MARQRLSRNQQRNIRDRQQREAGRCQLRDGLVVAHHGKQLMIEDAETQTRLRAHARRTLGSLATGDRIGWTEDDEGGARIEALKPRDSLLIRPDTHGRERLMAANLDQVVIVVAPRPAMNPGVVEQAMVAALDLPARPLLVRNKIDLLHESPGAAVAEHAMAIWQDAGLRCLDVSVRSGEGVETLRAQLAGHCSLLVGLSGVGKSSLTRLLVPQAADIAVAPLSEHSGEGLHTTRTSTLFHLPGGGMLIDAPGVRDFTPRRPRPESVDSAFPDILELAAHCRFANCSHDHEPRCAVRNAVASGQLDPRRLESYRSLRALALAPAGTRD